eukprot:1967961-Pyramimonas_sp.AAC.2
MGRREQFGKGLGGLPTIFDSNITIPHKSQNTVVGAMTYRPSIGLNDCCCVITCGAGERRVSPSCWRRKRFIQVETLETIPHVRQVESPTCMMTTLATSHNSAPMYNIIPVLLNATSPATTSFPHQSNNIKTRAGEQSFKRICIRKQN